MSTSVCDALTLAKALGSVKQVFAEQEHRAKAEFDEERQALKAEIAKLKAEAEDVKERHTLKGEIETLKGEIEKLKDSASANVPTASAESVSVDDNRSPKEYECVITNSPETAQGLDYKYSLGPEDEGKVMLKDGKIKRGGGKDGKDLKPQTYRAMKKLTPFFTEGDCKCGVNWDRAPGSKVLRKAGLTGTFRMGCGKAKLGDSEFCKKHQGGKSIYTEKYKKPINGSYLTHYEFLIELQKGGAIIA